MAFEKSSCLRTGEYGREYLLIGKRPQWPQFVGLSRDRPRFLSSCKARGQHCDQHAHIVAALAALEHEFAPDADVYVWYALAGSFVKPHRGCVPVPAGDYSALLLDRYQIQDLVQNATLSFLR